MRSATALALALEPLAVDQVEDLVAGRAARRTGWHPQYPAADTLDAATMLLAGYEAVGTPLPEHPVWWLYGMVVDGLVVGDAGFHGPPNGRAGRGGDRLPGRPRPPRPRPGHPGLRPAARARLGARRRPRPGRRGARERGVPGGAAANGFRSAPGGGVVVGPGPGGVVGGLTRHLVLDRPALLAPQFALLRRGAGDPTHRRVGGVFCGRPGRRRPGPAEAGRGRWAGCRRGPGARGRSGRWTSSRGCSGRPTTRAVSSRCRAPRWSEAIAPSAGHFGSGRTDAVFEALAPACIEQVVTGKEAFRAWRLLVREFGEAGARAGAGPGIGGVRDVLPPTPEAWARVPSWRSWPPGSSSGGAGPWSGRPCGPPRWSGRWRSRAPRPTGRCGGCPGSARGPRRRCGSELTASRRVEHRRLPHRQAHHATP